MSRDVFLSGRQHLAAQDGCAACGHEPLVEFYETEQFLVDSVTDYVVPALRGPAPDRGGARQRFLSWPRIAPEGYFTVLTFA